MATKCCLGLLMGSDVSSTLWEGLWVPPTVVVGALVRRQKWGETEAGNIEYIYVVINQSSPLTFSIFLSLCLLFPPPYTRTSNQLARIYTNMYGVYVYVCSYRCTLLTRWGLAAR